MTVSTKTLQILGKSSDIKFKAGENLLEVLNANNISIDQSCDGHGTCTTCRVRIVSGIEFLSERTDIEKERAEERLFSSHERLSCQTQLLGDVTIEILSEKPIS